MEAFFMKPNCPTRMGWEKRLEVNVGEKIRGKWGKRMFHRFSAEK